MRSPSSSRAFGGTILRFLIILGLVAYTGFIALKLTKQVPMSSVSSAAAPDASLASDVLDNQYRLLNLPQGTAPAAPDVPAPPGDQPPAAQDDGSQDAPDSGVDAPSPDQPQNIIRTVPAAPAGEAVDGMGDRTPGANADRAAPDASGGAPVAPAGPNAPDAQADGSAGAPVVPLDPSRAPADSAHKDQLRQFLHDSLQRALHNPQQ